MQIELVLPVVVCIVVLFLIYRVVKLRDLAGPGREADPIAEADVYLAYGRKSQAISILEKAESTYPNRADIRKKLNELRTLP